MADILLIASGGDDNSLAINLIDISLNNNGLEMKLIHTVNDYSTHTCQITGLFIYLFSILFLMNYLHLFDFDYFINLYFFC